MTLAYYHTVTLPLQPTPLEHIPILFVHPVHSSPVQSIPTLKEEREQTTTTDTKALVAQINTAAGTRLAKDRQRSVD